MTFRMRRERAPENGPKNDNKIRVRKTVLRRLAFTSLAAGGLLVTVIFGGMSVLAHWSSTRSFVKRPVLECALSEYGVEKKTIIRSELTRRQAKRIKAPEDCEKKLCKWKTKKSKTRFYDCEPLVEGDLSKSKIEWKPKRTKDNIYAFGMFLGVAILGALSSVVGFMGLRRTGTSGDATDQTVS